jgi:glycosyltransferase involved in cell wall biosynthesis
MPIFSIIVPVYNVEKYLCCCLDSVIAQKFQDYECILVDDGSLDNSPVICDEYAQKYSRIRVIHKKNGGLSDARNTGIMACNGEYIVLLDSDDLLFDENALFNLNAILLDKSDLVVFNEKLAFFDNDLSKIKIHNNIRKKNTLVTPLKFYILTTKKSFKIMAGWLFVINKEFLVDNNLYFETGIYHEDEEWIPRILVAAENIRINYEPFYLYRKTREGSITEKIVPKRLYDKIFIINKQINYYKSSDAVNKNIFLWRCAPLWFGILKSIKDLKKEYPKEYEEILKELNQLKFVLSRSNEFKYKILKYFLEIIGIKTIAKLIAVL